MEKNNAIIKRARDLREAISFISSINDNESKELDSCLLKFIDIIAKKERKNNEPHTVNQKLIVISLTDNDQITEIRKL